MPDPLANYVLPLEKITPGHYRVVNTNKALFKDSKRSPSRPWQIVSHRSALRGSPLRLDGYRLETLGYRTLQEATTKLAARMEQMLVPIKVRPLRRYSSGKETTYFSACRQLEVGKWCDGWELFLILEAVPCRLPTQEPLKSWLSIHGLDLPLPTLSQLCTRLERANEEDPLHLLLANHSPAEGP